MVVGDTYALTFVETEAVPFPATGAVVAITLPNAVVEPAPPVVTSTPGDVAAEDQTLTAYYLPAMGGAYNLIWLFNNGSALIQRNRLAWSYWSDVPTLVRDVLEVDDDQLPDEMLDREFQQTYKKIYSRFPYIGGYWQQTGDDQGWIDEAVAYMCAVSLWPVKTAGADGAVTRLKAGGFEFQYGTDKKDERNAWTIRAATALGYHSLISAQRTALAASWSPYTITGPSRAAQQAGVTPGLLDTVIDMFQDRTDQSLLSMAG